MKEKELKNLENWVFNNPENDSVVTTSLKVSEVFGKDHSKVLRDIRVLISKLSRLERKPNLDCSFKEYSYRTKNNQMKKAYQLSKDAFVLITNRYNSPKALQFQIDYIEKFNQMQKQLEEEKIKKITIKLEKLAEFNKEKIDFANAIEAKSEYHTLEETAKLLYKDLKLGRNQMFATLRRKKILDKNNLPYQNYVKFGYFMVAKDNKSHNILLVSNKGLNYIYNVIKNDKETSDQDGGGLQLLIEFEY